MAGKNILGNLSAARASASVFGILAGLGGMTHGLGEILQGNVAPDGIVINSWTVGPIAAYMGGDPGMTIIPNMLATGILNIIVTSILIIWAAAFVQKKNGGLILILLSVAMLLVGGGFAPPLLGILSGIAGMGINSSHNWWRKHVPANVRSVLVQLWPWAFGICLINGVFLVIGSLILVFFFGFNYPDLFVYSFFFAVITLILTIITGIAYDIRASGS